MIVGAYSWAIEPIESTKHFWLKLDDVFQQAKHFGVELLVLPELFSLELLGLSPGLSSFEQPRILANYAEEIFERLGASAREHGIDVIGGSHFEHGQQGILNVCPMWSKGRLTKTAKNKLTVYERDSWQIRSGQGLTSSPDPRVASSICYDCEFPEAGRIIANRLALVQCVPAFTETEHGFWRVRHSCHARAIENQMFVVQSSLVGQLGREPVPTTFGSSAIISPSIEPFPADGMLASTEYSQPGFAVAELDFEILEAARSTGDVRNWHDRDADCWSK